MFSDHKPLEKLNLKARTDEELGDLTYYLSQFNFEVIYLPGKDILEADNLSKSKIENFIKLEDIQNDQEKNEDIKLHKHKLIEKHKIYFKRKNKLFISYQIN